MSIISKGGSQLQEIERQVEKNAADILAITGVDVSQLESNIQGNTDAINLVEADVTNLQTQ